MMRFVLAVLICFAARLPARGETAPSADEPASVRFEEAYKLLTAADTARDEHFAARARELYRCALETYQGLAERYPEWQPGVVKFRIAYCASQIEALKDETPAPGPDGTGGKEPAGDETVRTRALRLLKNGQADEAHALLLEALKADPANTALRLLTGIAQCRAGRFEEAIETAEQVLAEDPGQAAAHLVRATACFGAGRVDEARRGMRKAIELDPVLHEAHFDLAQVILFAQPENVDEARREYERALDLGAPPEPEIESRLSQ